MAVQHDGTPSKTTGDAGLARPPPLGYDIPAQRTVTAAVPSPRLTLTLLPLATLAVLALALAWGMRELGPLAGEVLRELRLPRVLLALFTGSALALAGLLLQNFFRNPLVEPGLLGVSSGAGLAAVLVIAAGLPSLAGVGGLWLLPAAAFVGALATLLLVLAAGRRLGAGNAELLLVGVAINALAAALVNLLLILKPKSYTEWLLVPVGWEGAAYRYL